MRFGEQPEIGIEIIHAMEDTTTKAGIQYCTRGAVLKREVSSKFAVISKPKNFCLSGRNKKIIILFVINYPSSAIKLSMSASGQRQGRSVWIET